MNRGALQDRLTEQFLAIMFNAARLNPDKAAEVEVARNMIIEDSIRLHHSLLKVD